MKNLLNMAMLKADGIEFCKKCYKPCIALIVAGIFVTIAITAFLFLSLRKSKPNADKNYVKVNLQTDPQDDQNKDKKNPKQGNLA